MSNTVTDSPEPPAEAPPARHRANDTAGMSPARRPVRSTRVAAVGLLCGLLLIALAVVAGHDALAAAGLIDHSQWIRDLVDIAAGLTPSLGTALLATVPGALGLLLLWVALAPRRSRGVPVSASSGTYIRRRHLRRLISGRAESLDGVTSAHASGRKPKLRVKAVGGIDTRTLAARVDQAVTEELAVLDKPVKPRVHVDTRS